jgi:peptide/nickel transport system substrate-binding protein
VHFSAAIALVIGLILSVASPARADREELIIGIAQFPFSFHPTFEAMVAKSYVLGMTRRPFTTYDANWQLICMLCEVLPTIENGLAVPETTADGKDGVAVTYTIVPEAVWGDGTPITTRDVVFTWEVGRHPQSGVIPKEFYRSLYDITVKDDRTFTLHFDKLTFDYNAINSFELLPAHLETAAFAEPESYRQQTRYDTDTTNKGLYFGPYLISEVVSGSHVVLTPNPLWWGAKPKFSRIVVRAIENTAALEANLLSGAIDMIAGEIGLSLDQALAFEARNRGRYTVLYKPGLAYEHIDVNFDNPILADVRVRKALLHAIDRDAINANLFASKQPVALTNVNPLDWIHTEDVARYSHDAGKAAALLDEAGWTTMRRGIRHDANGNPLALEIMTTAGNRSREMVQQVLVSQWKEAGIDVRIRNEPARVLFGQSMTQRRFPAMAMYAWSSAPESVPRTTLYSDQIPAVENNWAGQNFTGYASKQMDQLIDAIEVELDKEKRKALWHQLQQLYAAELPALPLFFRADSFILPPWLKGVEPTGHQYPTTLWVETWQVQPPP